jgi:hypothetical protein
MQPGFYLTILIGPGVPLPAPREVVESLTSAQVTVSGTNRSSFQLAFAMSKQSLLAQVLLPAGYFDFSARVILIATIGGQPQVVIDGVVTRQEVTPSNQPGQSKLTITGDDVSAMMDLLDLSQLMKFPCMPAEAQVALILAKYALYGMIPLVIPSPFIDVPLPTEQIPSQQGTDYEHVKLLASRAGYVFFVEPGPVPGTNVAYWGPEIRWGLVQPALTINMDAHDNVDSMTFGFDLTGGVIYTLNIQEPNTGITIPIPVPDVGILRPPLALKRAIPLRLQPVGCVANGSVPRAMMIAMAKAAQAGDVVSGSGSLDVVRYGNLLRARQLVGVRGAGQPYDGVYYVKSVTHDISRGNYKQNFTLTREGVFPTTPQVPT